MASLSSLPLELRDTIWSFVCLTEAPFDLLRTSRQICFELGPYLYGNIVVHLLYPRQILRWIHKIGSYNSSCIRNLTLKFPTLKTKSGTPQHRTTEKIWATALHAMPKLDTIIYYYEPSERYTQKSVGLDEDHPCRFTTFERVVEKPGSQCQVRRPVTDGSDIDILESLPAAHCRPITHAVLAINEPMPEINLLSFMKLFSLDLDASLPEVVHGLSVKFFTEHGFELARTYTMIEDPKQQSLALTYRRQQAALFRPPDLESVFHNLPHLLYLRLGCPNIDSSFLASLPSTVQTIDLSFRDPEPDRISRNLITMRQRCQKLFTLAIAVSPLHDFIDMPDGGRQMHEALEGEESNSEWKPFWDALRQIQSTGVKVWEGEGPGFKRVR